MSGGRSRSLSLRLVSGGLINAKSGPTTRAPPKARASNGKRFSPRKRVCANTKFSQGRGVRSRCYWCLVIRPRRTTQWDTGRSHDSLHASQPVPSTGRRWLLPPTLLHVETSVRQPWRSTWSLSELRSPWGFTRRRCEPLGEQLG